MSKNTEKNCNRSTLKVVWHNVLILICVFVLILGFGWLICSALSILGPMDRPHFEDKGWKSLHVRYFIVRDNNQFERRNIVISGDQLSELKQAFVTKTSGGKSIPNPTLLSLELKDGKVWSIMIRNVHELSFCKQSDTYYAYHVVLTDTRFYEKLREYCWKDAVISIPECKIENISISPHGRYAKNENDLHEKGIGMGIGFRGEIEERYVPLKMSNEAPPVD